MPLTRPLLAPLLALVTAALVAGMRRDDAAVPGVPPHAALGAARGDAVPAGQPDARIDLTTRGGVRLVRGAWRYSDARPVEIGFNAPGADLKPSGPPNRTYDVTPHAGGVDDDDSRWAVIDPTTLQAHRGTGRLCFNWYRINVTVPERIGDFDLAGATAVFQIVVDDYAEVWVDGALPRRLGQSGENLIGGWNAPNRLVVGRDVRPGQRIQLAVFGINGPLSAPPANYIWVRAATLEVYRELRPDSARAVPAEVTRLDPALDSVVPLDARVERVASGLEFTEGPVWVRDGGYLLFSDPNANKIYKLTPDGRLSVFRTPSGYDGSHIAEYTQPGSNGLALDPQGRLTIDEHGNRRVTRLEEDGRLTVLADRYQGRRLNSPNDLVYRSDGALYFTDPPFGLPKFFDDPRKELPFSGVFLVRDGRLRLVSTDLRGPNGLAFSPDERYLYVDDWDPRRKVVMRYNVAPDGSLSGGRVFLDATDVAGEQAFDGMKVDRRGNLYVSGPGGLWVISPAGKHLGTIRPPELPANLAWGDDGRTLYMTARTGIYRVRLLVPGAGGRP